MPKECPMCGDSMELVAREETGRVPGTAETYKRQIREWTCRECDYFEEAAEDEG